ncbi:hypothetical protein FMUAM8_13490 [Nocardia cyriacigeorgica]|nr:hypothetical protein FMUAM8_13490 [Nocardia cyriacigeorgica]
MVVVEEKPVLTAQVESGDHPHLGPAERIQCVAGQACAAAPSFVGGDYGQVWNYTRRDNQRHETSRSPPDIGVEDYQIIDCPMVWWLLVAGRG